MRLLILVASLACARGGVHSDITGDLVPPVEQQSGYATTAGLDAIGVDTGNSFAGTSGVGNLTPGNENFANFGSSGATAQYLPPAAGVSGTDDTRTGVFNLGASASGGWIGIPAQGTGSTATIPKYSGSALGANNYQPEPILQLPQTGTGHKYTSVTFGNGIVGLGHSVDYAGLGQNQNQNQNYVNSAQYQVEIQGGNYAQVVPQPYQVTVARPVPVPVPVPTPIEIPRPVPIEVLHPVEVPVERPYPVTVTKPVPVPVAKPVYVKVPHAVHVPVAKPYPVYIEKHVPVHHQHHQFEKPHLDYHQHHQFDHQHLDHHHIEKPHFEHHHHFEKPQLDHHHFEKHQLDHHHFEKPHLDHHHFEKPHLDHHHFEKPHFEHHHHFEKPHLDHHHFEKHQLDHHHFEKPHLDHHHFEKPHLDHHHFEKPHFEHHHFEKPHLDHHHAHDYTHHHGPKYHSTSILSGLTGGLSSKFHGSHGSSGFHHNGNSYGSSGGIKFDHKFTNGLGKLSSVISANLGNYLSSFSGSNQGKLHFDAFNSGKLHHDGYHYEKPKFEGLGTGYASGYTKYNNLPSSFGKEFKQHVDIFKSPKYADSFGKYSSYDFGGGSGNHYGSSGSSGIKSVPDTISQEYDSQGGYKY